MKFFNTSIEQLESRTLLSASDIDSTFGVDGTASTYVPIPISSRVSHPVRQADGKLLMLADATGQLVRLNIDGSPDYAFAEQQRLVISRTHPFTAFDVQPDGKIVAACFLGSPSDASARIRVSRLNSSGSLDTTFGMGGYQDLNLSESFDAYAGARAVHVDHLGRVVVYGQFSISPYVLSVARFSPDGVVDTSFDGDGVAFISFPAAASAGDFIVQSDDKLVCAVAPYSTASLFRLNVNGSLDTSFGTNGYASLPPSTSGVSALMQGATGHIYTLQVRDGYQGDGRTLVSRFTANGRIDSSFAVGGTSAFYLDTVGNSGSTPVSMAMDGMGRIAVVGTSRNGWVTVDRLTANGALDNTFDGDGRAFPFGNTSTGYSPARGVLVDDQDRIISLSSNTRPGSKDYSVSRFTQSGALDVSYDGDGTIQNINTTDTNDSPVSTVMTADGKTLVLSQAETYSPYYLSISRINTDGTRDLKFGVNGFVNLSEYPVGLAQQPDGKLLVLTSTALFRFQPQGAIDTSFGVGGRLDSPVGNPTNVVVDSLGRIYMSGYTSVYGGPTTFHLARLTITGQLDQSFAQDGILDDTTIFANPNGIHLLHDNSLLLNNNSRVVRVDASGILDSTFAGGTGGLQVPSADAISLRVGPDGKIYIAGQTRGTGSSTYNFDLQLSRFDTRGLVDLTYGDNGSQIVSLFGNNYHETVSGMAFYADSTAVLSVFFTPSGSGSYGGSALVQFTPSGQLDPSFHGNGTLLLPTTTPRLAGDVYIDASQRIIATGLFSDPAGSYNADVTLTRYLGRSKKPVAVISGATAVVEGGVLALDGSSSTSTTFAIASYAWDFNYDGTTFDVDATGATPVFDAGQIDGPATRVVALRVTDANGLSSLVTTKTISITNAAPTAEFGGTRVGQAGQALAFGWSNVVDPGVGDGVGRKFGYDYNNDGDFTDANEYNDARPSAGYVFTTPGTFTVHGRVTDKDGAFTDYYTTVAIYPPKPTADPATTLEGESATFAGGTAKGSSNGGYTGTGYADFGGQNSSAQWSLTRTAAGTATLTFRYANGSTASRPLSILINGSAAGSVACVPTGSWTTWNTVSINVNLTAGANTIKAVATATVGGGNVDNLTITPPPITPPAWLAPGDSVWWLVNNTLVIQSGNATLLADAGLASPGLSIILAGGTLTSNISQHLATLGIESGRFNMPAGGGKVLRVTALAGFGMDLKGNDLILDYSGTSPVDEVVRWLRNGSLTTTAARPRTAAASTGPARVLGYTTGADYLAGSGSSFDGETIDATSFLIKSTFAGDATLDGRVDFNDFLKLQNNFGKSAALFGDGDFTGDGRVDFNDFLLLQNNFGAA